MIITCRAATRRWYAIRTAALLVCTHRPPTTTLCKDLFLLRLPRPRLGNPEPRSRLRANPESDAIDHRGDLVPVAARARVRALHAGDLPDRVAADGRPALAPRARGGVVRAAREPQAVRTLVESARDARRYDGGARMSGSGRCRCTVDDPLDLMSVPIRSDNFAEYCLYAHLTL